MPVLQISAFRRPRTLGEVWQILEDEGPAARLVGGGTDLTIHCPPEVTTLVDLAGAGLDRMAVAGDGSIEIGAMVTLTRLMEDDAVAGYQGGVMVDMLRWVGSPLLRNAATLGGHLARGFLSDVIPVLLAVDARVSVFDGAEREMSLQDYYDGSVHDGPHILTRVTLPPLTGSVTAFRRFSRSGFDHAIANAACRLAVQEGVVAEARVVVGAGRGIAARVPPAEASLTGSPPGAGPIAVASGAVRDALTPTGDYRSHLAAVLVGRCLEAITGGGGTA